MAICPIMSKVLSVVNDYGESGEFHSNEVKLFEIECKREGCQFWKNYYFIEQNLTKTKLKDGECGYISKV